MEAEYIISNDRLIVTTTAKGGELRSIRTPEGKEFLWQGDPKYWKGRSPVLFPYIGRLTGGTCYVDGQEYHMELHGLARYQVFQVEAHTDTKITFLLESGPDTLARYPWRFRFRVTYALEGATLGMTYQVEDLDEKPMYFAVGGHPGFQVPMEESKRFDDYRLRFHAPCDPVRIGFTPTGYRNGEDLPYPLRDRQILPLSHPLFDNEAVVLEGSDKTVTLEAPGGRYSLTASFPQMRYVGFWHAPQTDAPYVCIEPWSSTPAWQDRTVVLAEQEDLLLLEPGKSYENTWTVEIHDAQG